MDNILELEFTRRGVIRGISLLAISAIAACTPTLQPTQPTPTTSSVASINRNDTYDPMSHLPDKSVPTEQHNEPFLQIDEVPESERRYILWQLEGVLRERIGMYSQDQNPLTLDQQFFEKNKYDLSRMCYMWGVYPTGRSTYAQLFATGFIVTDSVGKKYLATACHNLLETPTRGLLALNHEESIQSEHGIQKGFYFMSIGGNKVWHVSTNHYLITGQSNKRAQDFVDYQGTALFPLSDQRLPFSYSAGLTAGTSYNEPGDAHCLRPDLNRRVNLTSTNRTLPPNVFTYYTQVDPQADILCRGVSGTPVINNKTNQVIGYLSHGPEIADDGCATSLYIGNIAQYELDGNYNIIYV